MSSKGLRMVALTTFRFSGSDALFEGVLFGRKPTKKQMAAIRIRHCFFDQQQFLMRMNHDKHRWAYMWLKRVFDYNESHGEGTTQTYSGLD